MAPKESLKRRRNGEGTAPKWDEARQRFVAVVTVQGKRTTLRDPTEAGLRLKIATKIADAARGRVARVDGRQTVIRYLRGWHAAAVLDQERRRETLRGYLVNIRHIERTGIASKTLATLSPPDVLDMLRELRSTTTLSERSITYVLAVLRVALADAVELGMLPTNPAQVSRRKGRKRGAQTRRKRIVPLTMAQIDALRAAASDERLSALFVVAVTCGLRRGELLGLRWRDVDLERRRMYVTSQLGADDDERLAFVEVKTESGEREVPLPDDAAEALRAHKDRQAFERQNALNLWQDHDLVFCNEFGGPIETTTHYRIWNRIRQSAGITCRFHDLRHTTAAVLLNAGVPLFDVSKILGHSSYAFTADVYGHLVPGSRRTADAMNAALRGVR